MPSETLTTTWAPRVLSVLRIMSALIFMAHGTQKILGFPASDRPAPDILSLSGIAGVLELFGGGRCSCSDCSRGRSPSCCPG